MSDQIASTCLPQDWSLCLSLRQLSEGLESRDTGRSASQGRIPVLDVSVCVVVETRMVTLPPPAPLEAPIHTACHLPTPTITVATRGLGCQASIIVPDLPSS